MQMQWGDNGVREKREKNGVIFVFLFLGMNYRGKAAK